MFWVVKSDALSERELVSFKSRKCRWKEQGKRRLEVIDIIDSSALPRIAKPIVKVREVIV